MKSKATIVQRSYREISIMRPLVTFKSSNVLRLKGVYTIYRMLREYLLFEEKDPSYLFVGKFMYEVCMNFYIYIYI